MLDLFDVGLYVSSFAYDFSIPDTAAKFVENIATTLKILFTMQREVTKLVNAIIAAQGSEANRHQNAFNRQRPSHESNPSLDYTRGTYCTPPKGSALRLPRHYILGCIPHRHFLHFIMPQVFESPMRPVCLSTEDSPSHLLFHCPSKQKVWQRVIFELLWPATTIHDIKEALLSLDFSNI
ncbi:unnamed protein product [Mucor fragilis]